VLEKSFDMVTDQSWIPSSFARGLHFVEHEVCAPENMDFLDGVPAMSATVLGLQMLLHERNIDLRKVSALVLSDVGATIQILRLIGREYAFAAERPGRMDDCIAGLDVGDWFSAMSARTFASDGEHCAATALWKHCLLVAQYAQLVAESIEGISPEDAYLVGLLHDIHAIPTALGWKSGGSAASSRGSTFALEGVQPLFVLAAMRSAIEPSLPSPWKLILTAAHELAGASLD
jgi:HDOD domain